jgi:hypothetical protein
MNPQTVLQERYPRADFSEYFRFLETRRCSNKIGAHDHHICPKKQFPEYEFGFLENRILLSVADHMLAHEILHRAEPELWAPSSWIAAASKGGRIGGAIAGALCKEKKIGVCGMSLEQRRAAGLLGSQEHKKNGTGFYSKEVQSRGGLANQVLQALRPREELHLEAAARGHANVRKHRSTRTGIFAPGVAAKAGVAGTASQKVLGIGLYSSAVREKGQRAGGRRLAELKTGIMSFEGHSNAGRIANHNRWHVRRNRISSSCSLCAEALC